MPLGRLGAVVIQMHSNQSPPGARPDDMGADKPIETQIPLNLLDR